MPPPPTPLSPPAPVVANPNTVRAGALSTRSTAGQPYMVVLYVGLVVVLAALVLATRKRRINKAAYEAEPEHWRAAGLDEFMLGQHTIAGIFFSKAQDRFRRGGRVTCALLSTCVQLVVIALLPLIRPESFTRTAFSLAKLLDSLLGSVLAMVLSLITCLPVVRWGASSLDRNVRRMAVLLGMVGVFCLLLVGIVIIFVLLRLDYIQSPGQFVAVLGTASAVSLTIVEPISLLCRYFIFGETRIATYTDAERAAGAAVASKASQVAPLAEPSAADASLSLTERTADTAAQDSSAAAMLGLATPRPSANGAIDAPASVRTPSALRKERPKSSS